MSGRWGGSDNSSKKKEGSAVSNTTGVKPLFLKWEFLTCPLQPMSIIPNDCSTIPRPMVEFKWKMPPSEHIFFETISNFLFASIFLSLILRLKGTDFSWCFSPPYPVLIGNSILEVAAVLYLGNMQGNKKNHLRKSQGIWTVCFFLPFRVFLCLLCSIQGNLVVRARTCK